jgi:ABC-2 type transport system ATP-binding protein
VAIIRDGRIVTVDRVEALRGLAHHVVELRFTAPVDPSVFAPLPGVSDVTSIDGGLQMRVSGSMAPVVEAAARHGLVEFETREPSLEQTFLAQYGRKAVEVNGHGH